jgi:cation diffusion facilitator CzcD-associated flavoprotein CzcO
MEQKHLDIIIIGAGLSGIDAACHFKMKSPNKSFTIFEARDTIGGTWDLFKYPGIRSDSDMHTFSYGFKPWTYHKSISDGETILHYLKETVEEYKIKDHIQFNHKISNVTWSSETKMWTVEGFDATKNIQFIRTCNFVMFCTGYYDYEEGYTPDYVGFENFKGEFIHPQNWKETTEYENKEVIVIGSGATAVTLVPSMADKTKHITMLQRSPTYVLDRPLYDRFSKFVHRVFPSKTAHFLARWKSIFEQIFMYSFSKKNPESIKKFIKKKIVKILGKEYDVDTHFSPKYNPWDERLCVVPDNDLFYAIKEKKCSIVTDEIERFTTNGILLKSGKELPADLIISATGLKIKILGGISVKVDGMEVDFSKKVNYKGIMLQDIPNALLIVGYTNASWTLKADLGCLYVCRLLEYMDKNGYKVCTPEIKDNDLVLEPIINFSSSYIHRAIDMLPKQANKIPWKLHQNYVKDLIMLKHQKIDDGVLEFKR